MKCAWKTCTNTVRNGRRFCNVRCKRKYFVDKRRKDLKQQAIAYKGGLCAQCGYNRCAAAMTFHHIDAGSKEFAVGADGVTRAWDRIKSELDKCVLLCANCHAEIHARQPALGRKTG